MRDSIENSKEFLSLKQSFFEKLPELHYDERSEGFKHFKNYYYNRRPDTRELMEIIDTKKKYVKYLEEDLFTLSNRILPLNSELKIFRSASKNIAENNLKLIEINQKIFNGDKTIKAALFNTPESSNIPDSSNTLDSSNIPESSNIPDSSISKQMIQMIPIVKKFIDYISSFF